MAIAMAGARGTLGQVSEDLASCFEGVAWLESDELLFKDRLRRRFFCSRLGELVRRG